MVEVIGVLAYSHPSGTIGRMGMFSFVTVAPLVRSASSNTKLYIAGGSRERREVVAVMSAVVIGIDPSRPSTQ